MVVCMSAQVSDLPMLGQEPMQLKSTVEAEEVVAEAETVAVSGRQAVMSCSVARHKQGAANPQR